MKKKILVTGGVGYIGSHTCVELQNNGYDVVIVDNLCNSSPVALERVQQITGREIKFHRMDIRNETLLDDLFQRERIDAVIHFAGLKAVGESVELPLDYYHNNIISTLALCRSMKKNGVRNLVFSSSATVYGTPHTVPIREDFPTQVTNPYGRTKLMVEEILRDVSAADGGWNIALLRYFNPVGAHESGLIGEDPCNTPNNLAPYISQVAVGRLPYLSVFGNDYPTPDGTGVRDYIHVMDLAAGHVRALHKLFTNSGLVIYNLGTGRGYSVLEMVEAFERVSGRPIPYKIKARRPGDIAVCFADPRKAREELDWVASRPLDAMVRDAWNWQSSNPCGYRGNSRGTPLPATRPTEEMIPSILTESKDVARLEA